MLNTLGAVPPSDAILLFNGQDVSVRHSNLDNTAGRARTRVGA